MRIHHLSGKQYGKAVLVGVITAVLLSVVAITTMRMGVSPLPAPLALAFAKTLLGEGVPLPVGLLFHVAWVTLWSVVFVVVCWDRLSLGRALALGLALWVAVLLVFFPVVGWGFFGLGVGAMVAVAALVQHILFAVILWALARWAFGARHHASGWQASSRSRD